MPRLRSLLPGLALTAAIAVAYSEVRNHDFVGYDDHAYVTENREVAAGLTPSGVAWAFTTGAMGHWEPLVWLSHMLVCELYGLRAGPHHVVNLLLHAANALLLFALLRRMTGRIGPSALAAGLFGLHPVHVESVAWVTERKDVLSTLLLLLTLRAYLGYLERRTAARFALTALSLTVGLMAKPMLVTLPLLMLLLDFWPLGRFGGEDPRDRPRWRLVLEKVPLLALCAPIAVLTVWFQQRGGGAIDLYTLPIPGRLYNTLVSYVRYLGHLLWPADLAAFYPHPYLIGKAWPAWQIAGSALLLALVSAVALRAARRCPYLITGWSWYLLALLPVIGVVQAGEQAMADRYAYVPSIGLYVAAAFAAGDVARRGPATRWIVAGAAAATLVACALQTRSQVRYWRDGEALFEHAVAANGSWKAHHVLGLRRWEQGRHEEAIAHFRETMRAFPGYAEVHLSMATLLHEQGRDEEAIRELRRGVQLDPRSAGGHYLLGVALASAGRLKQAVARLEQALEIDPDRSDAHFALGLALRASGDLEGAAVHFAEAERLAPEDARAR